MTSQKLNAGTPFPAVITQRLGGGKIELGKPENGHDWQMVVVYRGKHCSMCTTYLKELASLKSDFNDLGVDVVAVSGDPESKAIDQMNLVSPNFAVGYDLTIEQMNALGLYVSDPRSPEETDRPFSEPGIFVINSDRKLQVTDISNAPFVRPNLKTLLGGLRFIRNSENNYPIRGMHSG